MVVVNLDLFHSAQTLNLTQKNERAEIVITQDYSFEVREPLKFLQVLVVHYEIKTHINQMKLFHHVIELLSLQNFESVAVNE